MLHWSVLVIGVFLIGCAQPVAPSGGPVDKTPPELIHMYPPSNSVDFRGKTIHFVFSERVDKASFERALTIVPEPTSPPKLDWKGRDLEMVFQDTLSPSTTYVFTIDNALRDERGVAIREPIVRAIATGSVIDEGVISGRLRFARTGAPAPNFDVVATRTDTTESGTPSIHYRTQTSTDGTFRLKFLPSASFVLYAFEDRNRNRTRDAGEQFAVSPQHSLTPSSEDSLVAMSDWWVVNPDTSKPILQDIRARTSRRIELRFSEPVHLDTLALSQWALQDSISGVTVTVRGLYAPSDERRRIVLLTDSLALSTYRIDAFGTVRDSSGNIAELKPQRFDAVSTPDTMKLRFVGFDPQVTVVPESIPLTRRQEPGLHFNQYVAAETLTKALTVIDTAGTERRVTPRSTDGVLWRLQLRPPLNPGEVVKVTLAAGAVEADSTITASFRRLSLDETGSLTGFVVSNDDVVIELYSQRGKKTQLENVQRTSGDYSFGELTVGNYKLRVFADRDGDGEWNWGEANPYVRPEPLQWYPDSARVRAGWETVLDTLRLEVANGE